MGFHAFNDRYGCVNGICLIMPPLCVSVLVFPFSSSFPGRICAPLGTLLFQLHILHPKPNSDYPAAFFGAVLSAVNTLSLKPLRPIPFQCSARSPYASPHCPCLEDSRNLEG
ncbi:hypothetical protein N431DRAFT_142350 [Stipitochalara longipes BDJ]|nr:hypothetical protein N431DRAFT_142350 [Stipitochalara longipes BDJ]